MAFLKTNVWYKNGNFVMTYNISYYGIIKLTIVAERYDTFFSYL